MLVQTPKRVIQSTVAAHAPKRYFALLASLLGMTALGPLVDHWFWARIVLSTLVALSLLTAALAAEGSGRSRTVALVFAGLTGVMWMAAFCEETQFANNVLCQSITYAVTFLFFVITGSIMLTDVYTGAVTSNRICGAICVYVLMGFCFAMINLMIFLADSSAYHDSSAAEKGNLLSPNMAVRQRFPIFVYYSFCTLSTLGYGDIIPVSRPARSFSWLEAILGQIYLTVLVARLVGLHIAFTTSHRPSEF